MITYDIYAKFRNSQSLKDSDVAKAAGIPQSTFSDWKKGKSFPKQGKLQKIADALGVSFSVLLNLDEQPTEVPQYNPVIQEFIDILPSLTDEQINSLLHTAQLFASMNVDK